ncbi:glutaminase [Lysinibacillus contaminans]|uniref:Glutaminase n=1 Tax=Lysinibacillus contaminans TaxID=1293441 RepID=A0ABR5K2G0_9BACI|nr:glutaminase [Lysinibacillus contaminans]KOS68907.1 glutaminase [Lysinibacillus contaminans]
MELSNKKNVEHQNSQFLEAWVEQFRPYAKEGNCANYIPALELKNPNELAISIIGSDGIEMKAGDTTNTFTLQSVSKVVAFISACMDRGMSYVLERVDVEPTGDTYNSIVRLESHEPGKPFNPMINAGAITVSSMISGNSSQEKLDTIIKLLEKMVGKKLIVNEEVYKSEWETANRNRAIAYFLMDSGYLDCEVEEALEVYLKQCAIEVDVSDLAMIGLVIGNDGYHPILKKQLFSKEVAKLTKALMVTCGMYNFSGKFAAFIGLPAKSGVSGAILAAVPSHASVHSPFPTGCGIGIYGPAIDEIGNSVAGVPLLKHIATEWNMNIF